MDFSFDWPYEFVREGILVAVPLCFPSQSQPPPAGETAINVLSVGPGEFIIAGTTGRCAHVLAARIHGQTGVVRDAAVIPDAVTIAAVVGQTDEPKHSTVDLFAIGSGPNGSALWKANGRMGNMMIQEWGPVYTADAEKLCDLGKDPVIHAVLNPGSNHLVGINEAGEVLEINMHEPSWHVIDRINSPMSQRGRLICDATGRVWGTTGDGRLWHADDSQNLEVTDIQVPFEGKSHLPAVNWALDSTSGILYGGVEQTGMLFTFSPGNGSIEELGRPSHLAGIGALTVGHDGRLFGAAGTELDVGHLFAFDPNQRALTNLGVAASVLSVRQYGYHFRCAATGEGGEIYFGQHERVNHLWIYFPPIRKRK